jgi:cytidylate kinase
MMSARSSPISTSPTKRWRISTDDRARMIIAVDGPLASGKGTIARALAARFGVPHLDTGTLYRGVAVAMLEQGLPPEDAAAEAVARDAGCRRH